MISLSLRIPDLGDRFVAGELVRIFFPVTEAGTARTPLTLRVDAKKSPRYLGRQSNCSGEFVSEGVISLVLPTARY
jgi:hypothetical protein